MRSLRSRSARTRRAAALREEDECGLRTPFQRDRDRILHSKPFRRLKGKTQVFIDPAGDHYRTRMTHTLETTAIARGVARALRLNEDLTEAIGLGHDTGHPPFGHAGEEALDAVLRERFGRRFRHNEQSHPDRRVAEPDRRGPRRDPPSHRRRRARDARGEDRPHRRPRRLHQPRHRRRDPLRDPAPGGAAAGRDRGARPDRVARGSTRSCTTSSRPRRAPAKSVRETRSAPRCWPCARSCSSGSTSARTRGPSTSGRWRSCGGSSSTSSARGDPVENAVDYLSGMTDRFALNFAATLG